MGHTILRISIMTGVRWRAECGMRIGKPALEVVAEADAGAGVVEAGGAAAAEARKKDFELVGSGKVLEAEDLAGEILRIANCGVRMARLIRIKSRGVGEAFENPADGEVVFTGEVEADEEFGGAAVVGQDGSAEGLRGG
ncbi:MAG TPA: hypothetical protein VGR78_11225 [Verrucomicrobiae bacterium]|nr:hypothetical protein [Verrucomicrobiae bacterium]